MRKKELIFKLTKIINDMNSMQREIEALQQENKQLKQELEESKKRQAENIMPLQNDTIIQEEQTGFVVSNTEVYDNEQKIETPDSIDMEETYQGKFNDDVTECGSIAIGRIVQESIKHANIVSESDSENKIELLNLIMGKGELAKAEIFSITESDNSLEVKKELIDNQVSNAIDYFTSIIGQI